VSKSWADFNFWVDYLFKHTTKTPALLSTVYWFATTQSYCRATALYAE